MDLMRATRFDSAFMFAYSQRDKTSAARHLPVRIAPDATVCTFGGLRHVKVVEGTADHVMRCDVEGWTADRRCCHKL